MSTKESRVKAESFSLKSTHNLYRAWKVPGVRESSVYEGTGIKKTYDTSATGDRFPPDNEAVPVLCRIDMGRSSKTIQRHAVAWKELVCPECSDETHDVVGRVNEGGEKLCPECGLILSSADSQMARDASAAGRYD
jgi:hypothetical protein